MRTAASLASACLFASLVMGCSSAPEERSASTAAASSDDDKGTPFVAVPLTPAGEGFTPALKHFESYYFNDTFARACGGNYSADITVEFGEVTSTTMQVNAVIVWYHADPDVTIVPVTLDVYSKSGTNVRKSDEALLARKDGDVHRYEINKRYPVGSHYAVIFDFHSGAGLPSGDSSDFACEQLFQAAYYPEGTM